MSYWTHIVATIDVDTFKEDKNIKNVVDKMLENAPKITGSERDADIFVNVLSGHNTSMSCDCEHCEYKDSIVHNEDGSFSCDADENYNCPDNEYQTRVVITVIGDLRDRHKNETEQEYKEFIKYIESEEKCNFWIRNETVNIIDG